MIKLEYEKSQTEIGLSSIYKEIKIKIIQAIKNPDSVLSLKERIKILFVFGITVASILAAIIMIFTTIGLAISNGLKGKGGGGGRGRRWRRWRRQTINTR